MAGEFFNEYVPGINVYYHRLDLRNSHPCVTRYQNVYYNIHDLDAYAHHKNIFSLWDLKLQRLALSRREHKPLGQDGGQYS